MRKAEYKRWLGLPSTQKVLKIMTREYKRYQQIIDNGVPFISHTPHQNPVFEYGRGVGALYGLGFLAESIQEYLQDDPEEDKDADRKD